MTKLIKDDEIDACIILSSRRLPPLSYGHETVGWVWGEHSVWILDIIARNWSLAGEKPVRI